MKFVLAVLISRWKHCVFALSFEISLYLLFLKENNVGQVIVSLYSGIGLEQAINLIVNSIC